ncbi:hypothetical protein [Planomonospora parontospora]|uniref:hypothetical protein n=1 Tax=Planomonospora parontospora TaxID=58119 RepID=UPI00166F9424|nr:hypothetical protein [Planomonospora parontospora]GGL57879.1 hypothetical protein GCM10014719_69150 [Planomonospora parontospora subsp. antibiotica]GII20090.1 hypothetical protein Ppa05_68160 [Planomonospora parontospora subsp. antibiotica]
MKITIQGDSADLDALALRLRDRDGRPARVELTFCFDLVNVRLRRDPYSSAYRLCADLIDRKEAM